jgi:ubiquinone/menaquinone biosynthesis C-methylase UbiE
LRHLLKDRRQGNLPHPKMGFYRDRVIPRLIDLVMRNKEAARRRAEVLPAASGRVLEIGIGSGLNLPFYSRDVQRLFGVDPSADLLNMTRRKIEGLSFPVELLQQSAEELPLGDRSIDTAVATWVLCSIADPLRALQEIRRVLKPDGRMLFIEHGLAPDHRVRTWQQRLNPVWRRLSGGCNMNRKTDDLLRRAGFQIAELENFYLEGIPLLTYTYEGIAHPA